MPQIYAFLRPLGAGLGGSIVCWRQLWGQSRRSVGTKILTGHV